MKAFFADRFEEIIGRVDLKSRDCILVERSDEDNLDSVC